MPNRGVSNSVLIRQSSFGRQLPRDLACRNPPCDIVGDLDVSMLAPVGINRRRCHVINIDIP